MSELIVVAIITVIGNCVAIAISRWMSHSQHRKTVNEVREIKILMNDKDKK